MLTTSDRRPFVHFTDFDAFARAFPECVVTTGADDLCHDRAEYDSWQDSDPSLAVRLDHAGVPAEYHLGTPPAGRPGAWRRFDADGAELMMSCVHVGEGRLRDGRPLCPACQAEYDEDPAAWVEFGQHPAGLERLRRLDEEVAGGPAAEAGEGRAAWARDDVPF